VDGGRPALDQVADLLFVGHVGFPSSWTALTRVEPGPARTFIALGKIDP
jgi:hypothetical protein